MGMFDLDQYIIEQKLATLKFILCVKDSTGNLLGYVKHKGKGLAGPNFSFEDTSGTLFGEIDKTKGVFVPREYEVKDRSGQLVARIRFTRYADATGKGKSRFLRWWMEDPQGQRLFTLGKGDYREHGFPIIAPDGSPIAQVHKKWVTTRDSFSIEILRRDSDPFLILSYIVLVHERAHSGHKSIFDFSPY
jgi:uncharacterized protein YxjI